MNKILKAAIIINLIRLGDLLTTWIAINKFGIEVEGNLFLKNFILWIGNLGIGLIIYYVLMCFFVYYVLKLIFYLNEKKKNKKPDMFKASVVGLIIIFSLLPIWNLINIIYG